LNDINQSKVAVLEVGNFTFKLCIFNGNKIYDWVQFLVVSLAASKAQLK